MNYNHKRQEANLKTLHLSQLANVLFCFLQVKDGGNEYDLHWSSSVKLQNYLQKYIF